MTCQVLRAGDLPATPWKNGGGVTRQIAIGPEGAGLEDFDWRVSLATIESAGPFSSFPGVDRLVLVLEGRLELEVAGAENLVLDIASPAAAFPGDAAVSALAPASPAVDVNIMVRRGRFTSTLERRPVDGAAAIVSQDVTFILPCDADLDAAMSGANGILSVGDILRIDGARGALVRLRSAQPGGVVVAHVNAVR